MSFYSSIKKIIPVFLICLFFGLSGITEGQSIKELENQIDSQKDKLRAIDAEIARQQQAITEVVGESKTLNSALQQLTASRNALETQIKRTKGTIDTLELEIQKSGLQIGETEASINQKKRVIGQTLRSQFQNADQSMLEHFLVHGDLTTAWEDIDTLSFFNEKISESIRDLEDEKVELKEYQEEQAEKQSALSFEKDLLASEQEGVISAQQEKDALLKKTQNKESEYRKLLAEKVAQRQAFEAELFAAEQRLEEALSASEIPDSSVESLLMWPTKIGPISQYFGKTSSSGRLYASGTHNGIDIAVAEGTRLYATQSGTVKGLGNTDAYPGCYSYGKWILIEHDNGLSTLYAHLSSHTVKTGQRVAVGDVVGLSGNTGYSTGPHLHFTLFASQGVQIQQYSQSRGCTQASIPLTTKKGAYLDPMEYLPAR